MNYIIWLGSFGFKGTTEDNFWSENYDAKQELRFDFSCGFHKVEDAANWVFENSSDVNQIHYVHNDGLSDDHKPIKTFKR